MGAQDLDAAAGTGGTGADDRTDDLALLARVRGNDPAAIKQLYMRCSIVYPYVLRLCGDAVIARDVHHDTVTTIWKGGAEFRGESRLSSWIIAIARHLAFDALRARRREPVDRLELDAVAVDLAEQTLHDAAAPGAAEAEPSRLLAARQAADCVRRCIARLAPSLGECLLLVYYAQMTQSEVATTLGLNLNTAKSRIRDAHEGVRRCLAKLTPGDRP